MSSDDTTTEDSTKHSAEIIQFGPRPRTNVSQNTGGYSKIAKAVQEIARLRAENEAAEVRYNLEREAQYKALDDFGLDSDEFAQAWTRVQHVMREQDLLYRALQEADNKRQLAYKECYYPA